MNKRLLALFSVLAVVGTFMVSRIQDNVTPAELVDAGILNCPKVDLACEVRVSDEWLDALEARGADGGKRYRRIAVDARDCTEFDAGYVITDRRLYRDGGWVGLDVIAGRCKVVPDAPPDDAGAGLREMALECGCRKASGACRFQLADGGTDPVPFGVTVGPGYSIGRNPTDVFGGAGCARKSCVGLAAEGEDRKALDETWPEVCPGG